MNKFQRLLSLFLAVITLSACQSAPTGDKSSGSAFKVLAAESFLADIAQNIAGQRLVVDSLISLGMDPHTFEPTPADLTRISDCQLMIINGTGMEESWLKKIIDNAGGHCQVIEASAGLVSRLTSETGPSTSPQLDPHFFMDPILVIRYAENIRDAFIKLDPAGQSEYTQNAQAYIQQLKDLDSWISTQVAQIPVAKRLLVTNHESLGYYADRYQFKVVGTILPSASSDAQPSAQQIAQLITTIQQTGVKAIFLETGTNTDLAQHIAQDTGIQVINDLYEHSLSNKSGPAATYIEMMKYNTSTIVNALK
jgi:ABC-type Zn uptake system ZnuABC Zn-binding protein ZnuA